MVSIHVDFGKSAGRIKLMNCVNNGPVWKKNSDQNISNMAEYRAACFPYARTHDASISYEYGGEHTVDVIAIFPNFGADPEDPASYDFQLTDEYLQCIQAAGTKVFYRLGSKIEHWSKKYGTLPPKDFRKWAVVCEHIIRHCNEGWAGGFHMGIEYWEIWNEPDGFADDEVPSRKCCWGGTAAQFYELYAITAKYLKAKYPQLKIGGPAVSYFNEAWLTPFFEFLTKDGRVPMDFFSWHQYFTDPHSAIESIWKVREFLDRFGYTETESILNEWNYVKSFQPEPFTSSILTIIGMKGAAFDAAAMCCFQKYPLDMLMYYDARPCGMNGLFDYYTKRPLCGYYAFLAWSILRRIGNAASAECGDGEIYLAAAGNGTEAAILVSYYTDLDGQPEKEIELTQNSGRAGRLSLLDETHRLDEIPAETEAGGILRFSMKPNTVMLIRM